MSYREFLSWAKYRSTRGSLNLGLRIERGAALLATLFANANSKRGGYKLSDFMPHEITQPEQPITIEEAMKEWR